MVDLNKLVEPSFGVVGIVLQVEYLIWCWISLAIRRLGPFMPFVPNMIVTVVACYCSILPAPSLFTLLLSCPRPSLTE